MADYRRIGMHLIEPLADDAVIAFAGRLAASAKAESVHCVFVQVRPEGQRGEQADPAAYVRGKLPPDIAARTTVTIRQDNGLAEMLRIARDESLDLICVGRPLPSTQLAIGTVFTKLARKAPCNVLVVPEQAHPHVSRVLVPIDFSAHAHLALEAAVRCARRGTSQPQLIIQSVFTVEYGYSKAGLTQEEATTRMEALTRQRTADFIADIDLSGLKVEIVATCSDAPAHAVCELAAVRKMDLICIGSRGALPSAAVLLGGTAEKIIAGATTAVLVAKPKGETVGLLDVLLGRA